MKVLNEGRLIRRGYPVKELLCGRSFRPIGEFSHGFITPKLSFTDAQGITVWLSIDLTVYRLSRASANRLPVGGTRPRVFSCHPDTGALDQSGKPEEALPDGREMPEMAEAIGDAETIHTVRTRLTDAGQ
jgi:hypothetical protein